MRLPDVERVFRELGSLIIRNRGNGLQVSCPFAPYRSEHKSNEDRHPSMLVFLGERNEWVGKCYCCKAQGDLLKLIDLWGDESRQNVSELKQFVRSSGVRTVVSRLKTLRSYSYDQIPDRERYRTGRFDIHSSDPDRFRSFWARQPETSPVERQFDEKEIEPWFETISPYALRRGLDEDFIRNWEIGHVDPLIVDIVGRDGRIRKLNLGPRMMIIIRDHTQKLVGWSARAHNSEQYGPKYFHAKGTKLSQYLYGEHKIDFDSKRAYIVEGFADVWQLTRLGYANALAVMSGSASRYHLAKLAKWFSEIIVVPDGDKAGETMAHDLKAMAPYELRVKIVNMLPGKDPADIKDPYTMQQLIAAAK